MILEERAKAYQENIEKNNPQAEAYDFYGAYVKGATDERNHCIEAACDCFCDKCNLQYGNNAARFCTMLIGRREDCINLKSFRKTLEERL